MFHKLPMAAKARLIWHTSWNMDMFLNKTKNPRESNYERVTMIKRLCRKLILSYPFNKFFFPLAFSFPCICHIPSIFCSKPYWGYLCRTKRLDEYTSAWLLRHDITVLHFVSSHVNTSSIQNRMSRLYLRWSNDKWTSQAKCSWSCAIHLKALFIYFIYLLKNLFLHLNGCEERRGEPLGFRKPFKGSCFDLISLSLISDWLIYATLVHTCYWHSHPTLLPGTPPLMQKPHQMAPPWKTNIPKQK